MEVLLASGWKNNEREYFEIFRKKKRKKRRGGGGKVRRIIKFVVKVDEAFLIMKKVAWVEFFIGRCLTVKKIENPTEKIN